MGIYINMEMPTGNNAVSIIIFPNGTVTLAHDYHYVEYAKAIPVPDHGRLIDADALIKTFHDEYDDEEVHAFEEGAFWFHGGVMNIVDSAPTIIPADKEGGGAVNPCENCKHYKVRTEFTEPCLSCIYTEIGDNGKPLKWEPIAQEEEAE